MWKKLFEPVDMTKGDPVRQIVKFMIPMLIGNVFQQLYNTVDSIVVGKYIGDNALAAVGSASPVLNLLLVLFMGISVGTGIMVSQYFGARQRDSLSRSIGTCLTMMFVASLIVMVIGPLVTMPLLKILNTPAEIINWCDAYLKTIFIGVAGCAFYNILGGMLRGLGDSASALVYLIIATILNIFLDIFFVANLGLGVPGVAAYVIVYAVAVPVLRSVGATEMAANMFCLIYACLSNITPPVAMSSYVASGIADSDMTRTSLIAIKLGIAGFIVPFFFLGNPVLLYGSSEGVSILATLYSFATAFIGVLALASGLAGLPQDRENKGFAVLLVCRVMLIASGLLFVSPSWQTDLAALVLIAAQFALSRLAGGKPASPTPAS